MKSKGYHFIIKQGDKIVYNSCWHRSKRFSNREDAIKYRKRKEIPNGEMEVYEA